MTPRARLRKLEQKLWEVEEGVVCRMREEVNGVLWKRCGGNLFHSYGPLSYVYIRFISLSVYIYIYIIYIYKISF